MTCAGCGFAVAPDFAFCPKCGAPLAPSTGASPQAASPAPAATEPEDDRRVVTVLFADVSGFTAFGERLDPEDVRAFQTELHAALSATVERFDGFVEKFVGDAVMAVFGAPIAHEDDPQRALRAALAMHEAVEGLSARWAFCFGGPVALHIGINTGPVVAGKLGAGASAAYAVTGDTVNTASRLLGAARPGQTLASGSTVALTLHAFAFETLEPLALKGKAERVPVYRLAAALDAPRSARGLDAHGLAAPLIGRGDELAQMDAAFERAVAGRAQIVSLVGEAGAGKSRLQAEFFSRLAERGRLGSVAVRRVSCSSLGEQTYGVLAGLLREGYGIAPGDPLDIARRKVSEGLAALGVPEDEATAIMLIVGYVLGLESAAHVRHLEPEQMRRHIFLAARTLVERRLQHGALVLVVDDLHWADAASVEILRFMLDRLHDRPLMLLLAYRLDFDARDLVGGRTQHTTIRLVPLTPTESASLLGAMFGVSVGRCPEHLTDLVVARSGGNPFYVEEIVRGLIASGALVREAEGWRWTAEVERLDVPPTIQGLLLARLDRLPAGARRLLQEAAVLGAFDERLLRAVASEPEAFPASIDALAAAELLVESRAAGEGRGPRYRFAHALVQDTVYQNLLVRRRMDLHERAGRALEALAGTTPERLEDVEMLGHHWTLSRDPARGARYLVTAGDRARAIYANDDALRHYQRALATLAEGAGDDVERITVRERIADLLVIGGRREAALEHYDAAFARHEAAGDRGAQARLHRKRGSLFWQAGDRKRATASYEAGLRLLDHDAEHVEVAYICEEVGRLAFRGGDTQGAVEWAERALAHTARLQARDGGALAGETAPATAHAYNTLGVALARAGRLDEAVRHIEESIRVAEAHDLLGAACRGYTNLGVLQSTRDPGHAIETCVKGLETAKRIGDLGVQSRLYANLAVAYCALTNRCDDQGLGAAEASIALDRRLGQVDHLAVPLIVLGQIHQCHGAPDAALRYYREALGVAEEVGDPQLLFPCYDGLATLHLDLGNEAEAERFMQKAQEICERSGLEPDSLVVLPFLS